MQSHSCSEVLRSSSRRLQHGAQGLGFTPAAARTRARRPPGMRPAAAPAWTQAGSLALRPRVTAAPPLLDQCPIMDVTATATPRGLQGPQMERGMSSHVSAILAENGHTSQSHACCHRSDTGWIGAVCQSWVSLASNWPQQHPTMTASALSSCPTLECVTCPHLGGACHCRLGGPCPYRMVRPCRVRPRTALAGPTPRQGCHCVRPARLRRRRTRRPGARAAARFRRDPAPQSWRHHTGSVHSGGRDGAQCAQHDRAQQCLRATGVQAAALMWRTPSLAAWRGATPPQMRLQAAERSSSATKCCAEPGREFRRACP